MYIPVYNIMYCIHTRGVIAVLLLLLSFSNDIFQTFNFGSLIITHVQNGFIYMCVVSHTRYTYTYYVHRTHFKP